MIRLLTCSFLVFASIASCSGSSEVSHTESYASLAHPGAPASQIASESASPTSEASQASSPAHAPAHEAGPEEGEERKPVDVLSLFVIALLIGVFTHHVLKFTRLPYTALLMVSWLDGMLTCVTLHARLAACRVPRLRSNSAVLHYYCQDWLLTLSLYRFFFADLGAHYWHWK